MLLFPGVNYYASLIIAHNYHKMIYLVDPDSIINQNDNRKIGIYVFFNFFHAAAELPGIQSFLSWIYQHVNIQSTLSRFTVYSIGNVRRSHITPPSNLKPPPYLQARTEKFLEDKTVLFL